METKWVRPFILSAGGILLAAAVIRFVIATGDAQVLPLPDPMLGIPLRYDVLTVGGIQSWLWRWSVCLGDDWGCRLAVWPGWPLILPFIGLVCF